MMATATRPQVIRLANFLETETPYPVLTTSSSPSAFVSLGADVGSTTGSLSVLETTGANFSFCHQHCWIRAFQATLRNTYTSLLLQESFRHNKGNASFLYSPLYSS